MKKNQNIKINTIMVIACGALMVFISMGTRQSFGLFLQPITLDLSVGRETFSLAIAWQNLLFGLPLIGILADRFGSLDALNEHWTTRYWSQTYSAWEQIPIPIVGTHNPGLRLAFQQFVTESYPGGSTTRWPSR